MTAPPPVRERLRRSSRGAALALALAALAAAAGADDAGPQDPVPIGATEADSAAAPEGPVYPISRFVVMYAEEHPDQPPLAKLLPVRVQLGRLESGYAAPSPGLPSESLEIGGPDDGGEVRSFHATAIGSIGQQLLRELHQSHLLGVYVAPHEADLDLANESDRRAPGDTEMRLVISVSRVRQIRTVAIGDRIDTDWRVDNVIHQKIREGSPIQPDASATEGPTDLVRKDLLEDYLFRLNRHPGRRVEAALSATSDGEGAVLDYRVFEVKPWFVYARSSNTGSSRLTKWQQRFGFVHNQTTGRDDILSLEYTNAGLDDLNAVSLSYEAPWFSRERPSWYRGRLGESRWLSWFDRDKLPWPGLDRLRWQLVGEWSRFQSAELEDKSRAGSEDWTLGGRFWYGLFQHRAFFLDAFAGYQARGIARYNNATFRTGRATLHVPELGFRFERTNEYSNLRGTAHWDANLAPIDDEQLANLGDNQMPDDKWNALYWDMGFTTYLEPLLNAKAWEDPATARTSTLAHELALGLRGQYAFHYRLIPQASQVIGGLYSVRGYPQSAAMGDSVYLGTIEYRFHLPRSLPIRRSPLQLPWIGDFRIAPQQVYGRADWDLVVRAFLDAGYSVRNKGPVMEAEEVEDPDTLLGTGLGLELRLRNNLVVRADWGRALLSSHSINNPTKAGNDEFHFLFSLLY